MEFGKEDDKMYGQMGRKNVNNREVRLVRVRTFDSRMRTRTEKCGNRDANRFLRRFLLILILFTVTAVVGLVLIYWGKEYLFAAEESVVVSGEGNPPSGMPQAEPPAVSGNDIVVIEEEPSVPVIVIDPGHGGEDTGCSRGEVTEKTVNLQIALKLAENLQGLGYETVLTREDDDTFRTLEERVNIAEAARGDLFVSIHQNACEEKSGEGGRGKLVLYLL